MHFVSEQQNGNISSVTRNRHRFNHAYVFYVHVFTYLLTYLPTYLLINIVCRRTRCSTRFEIGKQGCGSIRNIISSFARPLQEGYSEEICNAIIKNSTTPQMRRNTAL